MMRFCLISMGLAILSISLISNNYLRSIWQSFMISDEELRSLDPILRVWEVIGL